MLAVTLGAGKKRPQGSRVEIAAPAMLADVLETHRPGNEAWWSAHVWEADYRDGDQWIGSSAAMVDLDYHGWVEDKQAIDHTDIPDGVALALEEAARAGNLPGSLFHLTPRGARFIFTFSGLCEDRQTAEAATRGAAELVHRAVSVLGLAGEAKAAPGLVVDPLFDMARYMFTPTTAVDGRQREAELVRMHEQPFQAHILAQIAPAPASSKAPAPRRHQQAAEDFETAVARYNADHAQEWPRPGSGECPACRHKGCFGRLPSDPARWACFSSGHIESVGLRGNGCHQGDALDLAAYDAGVSRRDLLLREGYWTAARRKPTPPAANDTPEAPTDSSLPLLPARPLTKSLGSMCLILRTPALRLRVLEGEIEFNEMLQSPTINRLPVEDHHVTALRERIEGTLTDSKRKPLKFGATETREALDRVAHERPFHPVAEYLEHLVWDRTPRIEALLSDVLDAEVTELNQALVRKWMISAVARVLSPGCQADGVLILQGPQGAGKSSFFRILAGQEWFSDAAIDMRDKDAAMVLGRIWILELAELAAVQRQKDLETVKAFITKLVDSYRPPYGHHVIDVPRRCVFGGTTNDDEILSDPTGNRRFWIVRTGGLVDRDLLASWRDQLWAEAVAALKAGEPWRLPEQLDTTLRDAQEEFTKGDEWGPAILDWADNRVGAFTITEALRGALNIHPAEVDKKMQMRVADILKREGFNKERPRVGGVKIVRWTK